MTDTLAPMIDGVEHRCLNKILADKSRPGTSTDTKHSSKSRVVHELQEQINDLQTQLSANRVDTRRQRRPSDGTRAKVQLATDDEVDESDECAEQLCEPLHAESGESSDGSHISEMAQAVQHKKKFIPRRKH